MPSGLVSAEASLLGLQTGPVPRAPTWPPLCALRCLGLFYEDVSLITSGPTLMAPQITSFKPPQFCKAGGWAFNMCIWGDTVLS